jgi:glutamate racemase
MAERWRPRLICIACNTASTIALSMVRDVLETPIVGTVPAIKPASQLTQTGVIGLLGTAATIRQGYVDRLEASFAQDKRLIRHAAPRLVEAAEARLRGQDVPSGIIADAVRGLRAQEGGDRIDTLVLACTHFPFLAAELQATLGPDIRLIDGADGIARRIVSLTSGQSFARSGPDFATFTGSIPDGSDIAFAPFGITDLRLF